MGGVKAFLRETLQNLIVQLLVLLIIGGLGLRLSVNVSSILGIQEFVWNNSLILVLVIIGGILGARRYLVARNLHRRPRIGIVRIKRRPAYAVRQFKVTLYGVTWRILYGVSTSLNEPYVFVEPSPYCPKCDYELDAKTKSGSLGFRIKHVWHCVPCDQDYDRNKDLFDEYEIVEKQVEASIRSGNISV